MGPDKIITDKSSLRINPPDILLTNYKMLDYLLIQPGTQTLWKHNTAQLHTLRYLVVDEFHTFDGAQGTDLACLLRRLKHWLNTPANHLACVGTSATLGGDGNKADMLAYATTIFEEPFAEGALIEEDRLSAQAFLAEALRDSLEKDPLEKGSTEKDAPPILDIAQLDALSPERYHTPAAYVRAQARLWLPNVHPQPDIGSLHLYGAELEDEGSAAMQAIAAGLELDDDWCIKLGEQLKTLPIVQTLVRSLSGSDVKAIHTYDTLLAATLTRRLGLSPNLPSLYRQRLLDSLMSLIATARRKVTKPDGTYLISPRVTLRIQYWFRELRRMVATIEPLPQLLYSDDLTAAVLDLLKPPRLKRSLCSTAVTVTLPVVAACALPRATAS